MLAVETEYYYIYYRGEWTSWSPLWMCGTGLTGKVVGIVGLGRIGFRVAEILKSFNVAKILYFNRTAKEEASKFDGEKVDFPMLLQNSDFVIVTVALTPQTRYMFNSWAFNQMKKTAIFVNGSRGDVVDQQALIDALKNNTIAAAGVDVTTPEPLPTNHELLLLDNCGTYINAERYNKKMSENMTVPATLEVNNFFRNHLHQITCFYNILIQNI